MDEEFGKQAEAMLNAFRRKEVLVAAHADHDGQAAAVALKHLFGPFEAIFHQGFTPPWLDVSQGKKLVVVCDLLLSEKQLAYMLDRGISVVNLDHHDVRDLQRKGYLCLNPKKIYGEQFTSSAGVVWRLFRRDPRMRGLTWILAAGAAVDMCIEDSRELFEETRRLHPELLAGSSPDEVYHSKLFKAGEFMLLSRDNPGYSTALLKKCVFVDSAEPLLGDALLKEKYLNKLDRLERLRSNFKTKVFRSRRVPLVCIDASGFEYPASVAGFYALAEKELAVYVEYNEGRLFFRNYFGTQDIRPLAALFHGGGAHARAGGAHSSESFEETCKTLEEAMAAEQSQKKLF